MRLDSNIVPIVKMNKLQFCDDRVLPEGHIASEE